MECFKSFCIFQKLYREEDVVSISFGSYTDLLSFYFSFIEYQDDFIYLSTTKTFNCKQNVNRNSFSQWPIKEDECEMILRFDGDYLYVYLNDINNLYGIFCRVDDKAINEYNKLIRTGKSNLSRVTWPHHADGTSDYDDEIKPPLVQLTDNDSVAEEEEEDTYTDSLPKTDVPIIVGDEITSPASLNREAIDLSLRIPIAAGILLLIIVIVIVVDFFTLDFYHF